MCFVVLLVSCPPLTDPSNGMINCSLGDDEVPSYEDNCSFICDTGYELTGSDNWTCQSDGSWSGSDAVCRRSESLYTYIGLRLSIFYICMLDIVTCSNNAFTT